MIDFTKAKSCLFVTKKVQKMYEELLAGVPGIHVHSQPHAAPANPHAALDASPHPALDAGSPISEGDSGSEAGMRGQARNEGSLKQRVLNDTLTPEFDEETPKHVWKRLPFKYRRWKANRWKRELCYEDGQLRTFLGGVWNHLLKPAGI